MSKHATVTALPTGPHTPENCKQPGADPDAWFPHEPGLDRPDDRTAYEETARQLCAGCPLIAACLEQALEDESAYGVHAHGIFGGRAPWERHNMHRAAQCRDNRLAVAS
jgi:hypothetical protein